MTSKLSTLLKDIDVVEIIGETDKNITSLESDSRKVEKDGLFVAVKGVTNDGHKYIPMVASAHVGAIVCENLPAMFEKGVTYISRCLIRQRRWVALPLHGTDIRRRG